MDIARGQDGHSIVGDSGKARVLLEVVGFLSMRVQNSQIGYIMDKSLNRQWFESLCSSQEEQERRFICCNFFMSSFILDNCCCEATGLVSKCAAYWVWGCIKQPSKG